MKPLTTDSPFSAGVKKVISAGADCSMPTYFHDVGLQLIVVGVEAAGSELICRHGEGSVLFNDVRMGFREAGGEEEGWPT